MNFTLSTILKCMVLSYWPYFSLVRKQVSQLHNQTRRFAESNDGTTKEGRNQGKIERWCASLAGRKWSVYLAWRGWDRNPGSHRGGQAPEASGIYMGPPGLTSPKKAVAQGACWNFPTEWVGQNTEWSQRAEEL